MSVSDKDLIEQLRYKATIIPLRESGAINLMKDAADRLEKQVVVSEATKAFFKAKASGFDAYAEWHEMFNAIVLLDKADDKDLIKQMRDHVASYKSLSLHRLNCLTMTDRLEKYMALRESVQQFVDMADAEDLLIGYGRNHPDEQEGSLGRAIREKLGALFETIAE